MKRREYLKTIVLGSVLPMAFSSYGLSPYIEELWDTKKKVKFKSQWDKFQDMKWAGPEYWGNRLQDWELRDGAVECVVSGKNRNLHLLTVMHQNGDSALDLEVTIAVKHFNLDSYKKGCVGMLLGSKGKFDDYRSAAVFGKGLEVGLSTKGQLQVGEQEIKTPFSEIPKTFKLQIKTKPLKSGGQSLIVRILNPENNKELFESPKLEVKNEDLAGTFALLSNIDLGWKVEDKPTCSFSDWVIEGNALQENETQLFGPVCFAQYTLNRGKLKLMAQCSPFESLSGHSVGLEIFKDGAWQTISKGELVNDGRNKLFEVENWREISDVPYRVCVELPQSDGVKRYYYEGTIKAEPKDKEDLNIAVLNCNMHYGFPDQDIVDNLNKLSYDVCVFLGDQFYEGTGGYGVQYQGEYDKRCLDFLRKWMMFGWSYREVFRHHPCSIITDDHDVFHGNLWGCGGTHADVSLGYGSKAQDSGGYKMDADWVNMAQFTQTGHLPDPYDATPVKQGINVYYTQWDYAGVSFAILEDRKFKSAPKTVLPEEADVFNGFIRNTEFDIKKHRDIDAELLGERQETFLKNWVDDWSNDTQMKILLSQTNFATIATLPKGSTSDDVVPKLYVPEKGEYVEGDDFTKDMDSNGWPQKKRDESLEIIRKGFTFHIAGDQHLGTFVQYGVEEHGDSGFAFTGPALNNIWPRRFWPPVNAANHSVENPAYTGDYEDGFGNKISVHAVTNPYNHHKEPAILYNRSTGFGMVSVNKKKRTITSSCYQRFKDINETDAQYPGWPITVTQEDQLFKKAKYKLPKVTISSDVLPVIRVVDEQGDLVYSLPLAEKIFLPKVYKEGNYTMQFLVDNELKKEIKAKSSAGNVEAISIWI
ncbi:alkaline phosphatase D family protein [Aestuariibaculum marinum]|uniref:Alkaline phosphatase D family protein n=1 Tax=Aestuariibaculum marinum TaxID=2683592 RepID=A0A8J6Q5B0_9FLAO|nr:alkaline phosphatase D family protein [Aestuariibaculum marinum]MBD0824589.1 alkaline phosphatase D family protein [Aestuariibaculum marinum]